MSEESDGTTTLPPEEKMRELGFTDRREGYWYWCRRVDDKGYTTLNFTINKKTGSYTELVMNESFGQPEYYGHMKPKFRDETIAEIEKHLDYLNSNGLQLAVDHRLYGCEK